MRIAGIAVIAAIAVIGNGVKQGFSPALKAIRELASAAEVLAALPQWLKPEHNRNQTQA